VLGNLDQAEIEAGRMDPAGEAATRTGRLCGKIASIVFLVLFAVGLVLNVALLTTGAVKFPDPASIKGRDLRIR
jgi:hypothetical protein